MSWIKEYIKRQGDEYVPMVINGSAWIGLAFATACGLVVDKWIEMKQQAIANGVVFELDAFQWAKAVFGVLAACLLAFRNFRDGSYSRHKIAKKESDTELLYRQQQSGK